MYRKNLVYAAACIGMVFFGIAFIVMGSVLPSLTEKYQLDPVSASSLVTFLPVGVLTGSVLFGPIVDRFGYKILLIVSTILTMFGLFGLSTIDDLAILRLCIFCIGLGGGMLNGSTNALASDISDDAERASKLSILGVFYGVGALGVPILLGTLSKIYSYEIILQWTVAFMSLCVLYFVLIRFPAPKVAQGFPIKKTLAMIKKPTLLILSFFLFFQSGLEGLYNNWTTSYLKPVLLIDEGRIVLTLTFLVLGMTIARLVLSYVLTRVKQYYILVGSIILSVAAAIAFNYVSTFTQAAVCLFAVGCGLAAGFPIIVGIIGATFKETTGTAIGFALVIALTGNSILNYLMGHVSERFEIHAFPIFLTVLLILQGLIVIASRKIINNKQ